MVGVAPPSAAVFIVATVLLPHIGSLNGQQQMSAQPAAAPYPADAYLVLNGSSPYYKPVVFQPEGQNGFVLQQPGAFRGIPSARLVWRDNIVDRADYQALESRIARLEARLKTIEKAQAPTPTKIP